jgi:hypothetical protein
MDKFLDLQLFAEGEPLTDEDKKLIEEAVAPVEGVEAPEVVLDPANLPTPEPLKPEVDPTTQAVKEPQKGYSPTSEQLARVNAFTHRTLTAEEVAVIPIKFVGDGLIEERLFAIEDKALEDLAGYANSGVAFLLDHQWASWGGNNIVFPFGRTFDAKVEKSRKEPGTPDSEQKALYGHIYIVKGKEINGITTDTVIASFEDGTLSDVSVTFTVSEYVCSICGRDIWDSKCDHAPGKVYDGKRCYYVGKAPARLYELSGVWDGAYPSAKALSADGVESQYEEVTDIKAAKGCELLHVYNSQGFHTFKKRDKDSPVITPQIDEVKAKEIAGENWQENIFKLASDGKTLRNDLIEDAIKWGNTALFEKFDEDFYRKQFVDQPAETIKAQRNQWKALAEAIIPVGRKVATSYTPAPTPASVPDQAFRMNPVSNRKELMP